MKIKKSKKNLNQSLTSLVLARSKMMTSPRDSLFIKVIVEPVKDQTLKLHLTSRQKEKHSRDNKEDKSKEWLVSLTKKLDLGQMTKRRTTL